jgi:hypothetical protein
MVSEFRVGDFVRVLPSSPLMAVRYVDGARVTCFWDELFPQGRLRQYCVYHEWEIRHAEPYPQ